MANSEAANRLKEVDEHIKNGGGLAHFLMSCCKQVPPGTCCRCLKKIPKQRIAVLPDTKFCVLCQEVVDKLDPPKFLMAVSLATTRFAGDEDRAHRGSPTLFTGNRRTATA